MIRIFRRKAESVKGRGPESVRRGSRDAKAVPTPEFDAHGEILSQVTLPRSEHVHFLVISFCLSSWLILLLLQGQSNAKSVSHKFNHQEDNGSGFPIEPPSGARTNGFTHSSSMVHPSAADYSVWTSKVNSMRRETEFRTQTSFNPQPTVDLSNITRKDEGGSTKDASSMV